MSALGLRFRTVQPFLDCVVIPTEHCKQVLAGLQTDITRSKQVMLCCKYSFSGGRGGSTSQHKVRVRRVGLYVVGIPGGSV